MNRLLIATCIGVLLWRPASGQDAPIVRATMTPEAVNIGESAELTVTVLVPTWFPRPPVFPSFEIPNAITRLPPDSSFPTSERFGRTTWSGIVRRYRVSPLVAATYTFSGLAMTVTYVDAGSREPVTVAAAIPDLELHSRVPSGAEQLDPYIAGTSFSLERQLEGDVASLAIGDALVVTYVAELDGLPAIFLPTLAPALEADGVSVYAEEPGVEDGPPARRTERQTLVFETGGTYLLPPLELEWWNTASRTVETSAVPALPISVAGPAMSSETPQQLQTRRPLASTGLVLILLLSVALLAIYRHKLRRTAVEYRERVLSSERYAFRRVRNALRAEDMHAIYEMLSDWIARLDGQRGVHEFVSRYGSDVLGQQIHLLSSVVYAHAHDGIDLHELEGELIRARRAYLDYGGHRRSPALPPLNPV